MRRYLNYILGFVFLQASFIFTIMYAISKL